ncbi:YceI family protein [Flavobacterium sp. D11R37]|uniref:YceI family protein n=1 Tax=Flavobacterium coralii TaxID=2838017 RepID=UPI001CA647AA|nr:YceI family protein [Flavobacterium coralii]MBY8963518.1 YceI family protein [Flavobacterium coralii]
MKKNIILLFLLMPVVFYGQKFSTRTGTVKFEATVPSFEEVAAQNKSVSAALDASGGEVAVLALMKGFRFKVALMEEHFNESYAETDKFPKATFKGKIEGLDITKLNATGQVFTITGDLTLHGKTKKITDRVVVTRSGNTITITGSFKVKPADFGIEIPKVVSSKIAETVTIEYNLPLNKQ